MALAGRALVRQVSRITWELRTCWSKGWRVSLTIDGDEQRTEGFVRSVSATDAYVVVGEVHVPADRILAVHRPSRLGDSEFDDGGTERWRGRVPPGARRDPRQLTLPGLE